MLPDRQTETVNDVVKFASIEELEGLSADKIPGNNSGYEITSLSYECVDTIELRALLLDVTATLKSKSPASGSNTRTVKFSAEVGPELVSVEYVPGGETTPVHDNIYPAFYAQVERYRNYSDGSRIGPDKFYDYGHFIEGGYGNGVPFQNSIYSYDDVVPEWIGANINPEYCFYENGWHCYYDRDRLKVNINAVVRMEDGVTYYGDDLLCIIPKFNDDPFYSKEISEFETFKTNFYGKDEYGYDCYRYSAEEPDYVNMCSNVPDVSVKPFPKDEKSLSTGWYFGYKSIRGPEDAGFYSKCFFDPEFFFPNNSTSFGGTPYLGFYLQYLVIDGRIIHFADLCDYKYLGREFSVNRNGDNYRCHFAEKYSLYGANFKLIYDLDVVPVNGEHIEIDYRDYHRIDIIDENNKESRSSGSKSRSSEPISGYDLGKTIEIDTSLPKSVRNISKSRTFNY